MFQALAHDKSLLTDCFHTIGDVHIGQTIAIVIGPEGGFSEKEYQLAKEQGYKPVSLGKRILRAETAAIYALSVISNTLESK